MANTQRLPLVTLGWQSWSIVVIVLVVMLTAAAYLLLGWRVRGSTGPPGRRRRACRVECGFHTASCGGLIVRRPARV